MVPDRIDEILRCCGRPCSAEQAAQAAVAVWLAIGRAKAAVVILFQGTAQCVVARGVRDDVDAMDISADEHRHSVSVLFDADGLRTLSAVASLPSDSAVVTWPDRLAACCLALSDVAGPDRDAVRIVQQILAKATRSQSLAPDPDRLEALAEFAAGAGHEINNPLGSIIGQSQLLLKQEQQTDRRQALATIGSQAWRIRDMIGDCMLFARPPALDLQSCRLSELIRQAATRAAEALRIDPDCLRFRFTDEGLTGQVDLDQFRTMVSHLVRNALEACRDAGIRESATIRLEADTAAILLKVEDEGSEITDEAVRKHLFDPFFSGRQAGRGLGFGLPVSWQIARRHGGLLLQETRPEGGNLFLVAIPGFRQPPRPRASGQPRSEPGVSAPA